MPLVMSSMAGTVWKILVEVGDKVSVGQDVIILESMKMEVPVQSSFEGTVSQIKVQVESFVNENDALLEVTE